MNRAGSFRRALVFNKYFIVLFLLHPLIVMYKLKVYNTFQFKLGGNHQSNSRRNKNKDNEELLCAVDVKGAQAGLTSWSPALQPSTHNQVAIMIIIIYAKQKACSLNPDRSPQTLHRGVPSRHKGWRCWRSKGPSSDHSGRIWQSFWEYSLMKAERRGLKVNLFLFRVAGGCATCATTALLWSTAACAGIG